MAVTPEKNEALAQRVIMAEQLALASGLIPNHPNVLCRHTFIHGHDCAGSRDCTCEPRIELTWIWQLNLRPTVH